VEDQLIWNPFPLPLITFFVAYFARFLGKRREKGLHEQDLIVSPSCAGGQVLGKAAPPSPHPKLWCFYFFCRQQPPLSETETETETEKGAASLSEF